MAVLAYTGKRTCPSSTGNESVTGLGFQPKALIFFGFARQEGSGGADFISCVGFTDGTSQFVKRAWRDDSSSATAGIWGTNSQTDACIFLYTNNAGPIVLEGAYVSFDADGFTLNWSTTDSSIHYHYIALGGDISVKAGTMSVSAVGTASVTGVGFTPTGIMFVPDYYHGMGWSDSELSSVSAGFAADTNGSGTIRWSKGWQSSDYPILTRDHLGTVNISAVVDSYDADGFTVTTNSLIASPISVPYLAVSNCLVKCGTSTQYTAIGNTTLPGVNPALAMLGSFGHQANSGAVSDSKHCLGASDGTNQGSICITDLEGAANNVSKNNLSATHAIEIRDATTSSVQGSATCSLSNSGATLAWDSTDSVERQIWYCLIGVEPTPRRQSKKRNSVEIKPGGTHHMTFTHSVTGMVRDDFTITLIKNGEINQATPIEVRELAEGIYHASFVNDQEDHAIWTLVIEDPDTESAVYFETWRVRKLIAEQNVMQIRSRMDSDGGFFKTSSGE